jgi:hypothetical protein
VSLFAAIFGTEDGFSTELFGGIGLVGLVLVILQTITGIFVGHDGDTGGGAGVDLQGGHGGGGNIVSIKTISAMLLGFGFGGAILEKSGFSTGIAATGGLGVGVIIGVIYFAILHALFKLKSDGTSVLSEAVNHSGTVYMRIPGQTSGSGEIQISFGGRMQNVRAFTRGLELPTGTAVKVVALHGDHALLVEKL